MVLIRWAPLGALEARLRQSVGPMRRAWRAITMGALLTSALTACGGGGSSASDTSQGGGTPPVAQWMAEMALTPSGQYQLAIWDTAAPIATRQLLAADSSAFRLVEAEQVDASTGARTVVGTAQVLFVQNGQLMRVALRGNVSHTPVQVSDVLGTLCTIWEHEPLKADGSIAAVVLDLPDEVGDCDTEGGNVLVRTDMTAEIPPLPMSDFRLLGALQTPDGQAHSLLLAEPVLPGLPDERLSVMSADFGPRHLLDHQPASLNASSAASVLAWSDQPGQAYVAVAGEVHRLSWSATTVDFEAAVLHTATSADLSVATAPRTQAVSDGSGGMYLADGTRFYRIGSTGSTLVADLSGWQGLDYVSQLRRLGQRLLVSGHTADGLRMVFLIDVATGGPIPVVDATDSGLTFSVVSTVGSFAVVSQSNRFTGSQADRIYFLVDANGGRIDVEGTRVVTEYAATRNVADEWVASGLWTQVCPLTSTSCEVRRLDLQTQASTTLGSFQNTGNRIVLSSNPVQGLPGAVTVRGASTIDVWSYHPQATPPLQRLTENL